MLDIVFTSRMKKDVKFAKKQGKDLKKLTALLDMLSGQEILPEKYKDHSLKGDWQGFKDCHIEPDWLLIYKIDEVDCVLYAVATGSHSYLRIIP